MRNNPVYVQLLQYALDHDYTIAQVEGATAQQVANVLGIDKSELPNNFENARSLLIRDLQERDDNATLAEVKSRVQTWLDNNFPDWEGEKGREGDKRFVKIWLDGKPEVT
tara:strand:+ start:1802 stop:2131 length:330 start_codon:yes stop_codon:yes gene_type:complete